jgi:outer membrane murein-binding lipoprotein Lpp
MGRGSTRSVIRRARGSRDPLSTPSNDLRWRVDRLERDVADLQKGQPAVIAERVTRLSADVENLRRDVNEDFTEIRTELASQRKILIGAFVSIATGLILSYVLGGGAFPA